MSKKKTIISLMLVMWLSLIVIGCTEKTEGSKNKESFTISSQMLNTTYQGTNFEDERVISFVYKYSEKENMKIEIRPQGASRLPNVGSMYLVNSEDEKIYLEMFSDSLMPYKVYAENNGTNKRKEMNKIWTGGWHGADGSSFNLPSSAINTKFELYIDGERIDGNTKEAITTNEAVILIENLLCAYNTVDLNTGYNGNSRPVMKETQTLTLKNGNIEVSSEIEALEDISMKTMYGIAMNINSMNSNSTIRYMGTSDEGEKPAIVETQETYIHDSGVKSDSSICNRVIAENKDTGDVLEMYMDTEVGLGNYDNLSDKRPMAFTANYKKIYFNLVDEKELSLSKGQKASFVGGWNIYNKNYGSTLKNVIDN